jgi:hypothetical protein
MTDVDQSGELDFVEFHAWFKQQDACVHHHRNPLDQNTQENQKEITIRYCGPLLATPAIQWNCSCW